MITVAVSALAAIWIAGLAILAVSARRAPVGREDEDGFHALPEEPKDEPVYGAETQPH